MTPRTAIVSMLLLVSIASAPIAIGQSRALQQRLAAAKRVDCTFTALATGTWEGAKPQATITSTMLEASFHEINVDEGTAEAGSELGDSFISVRYAMGYLHFMQMSGSGPLYVTTVLAQETTGGRMKAVHTRHEYTATILPGFTSRPEMYVGDCAVQ
jgi:hypothetical protein